MDATSSTTTDSTSTPELDYVQSLFTPSSYLPDGGSGSEFSALDRVSTSTCTTVDGITTCVTTFRPEFYYLDVIFISELILFCFVIITYFSIRGFFTRT